MSDSTYILGTGSYLPKRIVTNEELEEIVDTSDEWIVTRTGIKTRRIAGAGEETSKMAVMAARNAMEMANVDPRELDIIILGTITNEMTMPSCACLVQKDIGALNAFAYDINAACCGFIYGLDMADAYLRRNPDQKILVIGAETLSSRTNWQDRNTCVLWGDGAGAAVVSGGKDGAGLIVSRNYSDGSQFQYLYMDCAAGLNPDLANANNASSHIVMEGREVFKIAVRSMEDVVLEVIKKAGLSVEEIDYVIPHQANIRILNSLLERLSIPKEKVYFNVDKYGNTSAASVPIALDEVNRLGRLKTGDKVLFCAFGGGFTWGASILQW